MNFEQFTKAAPAIRAKFIRQNPTVANSYIFALIQSQHNSTPKNHRTYTPGQVKAEIAQAIKNETIKYKQTLNRSRAQYRNLLTKKDKEIQNQQKQEKKLILEKEELKVNNQQLFLRLKEIQAKYIKLQQSNQKLKETSAKQQTWIRKAKVMINKLIDGQK